MGCDIHLRCERRVDGKWVPVESKVPNPYYNANDEDQWEEEFVIERWYRGRNYELFTMLANVRAYGSTVPISDPKGFPDDASADVKAEYERWEGDAHSASYLTLRELDRYFRRLSAEQKEDVKEFLKIINRMREAVGQKLLMSGHNQDEELKVKVIKSPLTSVLTRKARPLEELDKIDKNPSFDDIRIVFWFDN